MKPPERMEIPVTVECPNGVQHEIERLVYVRERECENDNGWCSNCEKFLHDGFHWCPWCGAKVREAVDNG